MTTYLFPHVHRLELTIFGVTIIHIHVSLTTQQPLFQFGQITIQKRVAVNIYQVTVVVFLCHHFYGFYLGTPKKMMLTLPLFNCSIVDAYHISKRCTLVEFRVSSYHNNMIIFPQLSIETEHRKISLNINIKPITECKIHYYHWLKLMLYFCKDT